MIPKFDNFFLPCLQCLSDDNIHNQESIRRYVIDFFKLSAAEASALIKSGKKTQVSDRVSWTVSYFLQAGLIDAPQRGTYKINDFGKKFLSTTTQLAKTGPQSGPLPASSIPAITGKL